MTNPPDPNQRPSPEGEIAPLRPATWEEALRPAEPPGAPRSGAAPTAGAHGAAFWLKVLFPVVILVGYLGWKFFDPAAFRRSSVTEAPRAAQTLTGVAPAAGESLRMDRELKEYIAQLEALRVAGEWRRLKDRVGGPLGERFKSHPLVEALGLLARTRLGERNAEVLAGLTRLDGLLTAEEDDRYADLLRELRAARVDQMLPSVTAPELLHRRLDQFLLLLGPEAKSDYEVRVRQRLAERCEEFGDTLLKEGDGYLRNDVVKIGEARSFYQSGLRFVTSAAGWKGATPVSPAAALDVQRLLAKLRTANAKFHGVALPFTNNDNTTWTGRKGDPVHDAP